MGGGLSVGKLTDYYGTILRSAMSSMKSSTILALSIVSGRLADWLALCWLTFCPVIHSLSTFQRWQIQRDNSNRHGVFKCRGTIFARAGLASI